MKVIYPGILNEPTISYTWGSRIKSFSLDLVIVFMVMGVLTWIVN